MSMLAQGSLSNLHLLTLPPSPGTPVGYPGAGDMGEGGPASFASFACSRRRAGPVCGTGVHCRTCAPRGNPGVSVACASAGDSRQLVPSRQERGCRVGASLSYQ